MPVHASMRVTGCVALRQAARASSTWGGDHEDGVVHHRRRSVLPFRLAACSALPEALSSPASR